MTAVSLKFWFQKHSQITSNTFYYSWNELTSMTASRQIDKTALWKRRASLITQLVKSPPAIQETPVWFLGREDPIEKGQTTYSSILGLALQLSWERIHLQCRRPGFNPWVGKIPWTRKRLQTSVFWPGEFHRLYSPWGHKELDMTERLSLHYMKK